jgi:hypothetical protein
MASDSKKKEASKSVPKAKEKASKKPEVKKTGAGSKSVSKPEVEKKAPAKGKVSVVPEKKPVPVKPVSKPKVEAKISDTSKKSGHSKPEGKATKPEIKKSTVKGHSEPKKVEVATKKGGTLPSHKEPAKKIEPQKVKAGMENIPPKGTPVSKPSSAGANGSQPKRKLVISFVNLSDELLDTFKKKYPLGYHDHVIKVNAPNDKVFYAVTLDTADASYLVKVDVKIDTVDEDEFTEPNYGEEGDIANNNSEEESFSSGDEEVENVPDEED